MLVECITERVGLTEFWIGDHKFQFMPIPGAREEEPSTSVCNVSDEKDLDYMLGNPDKKIKGRPNFRKFNQEQAYKDHLKRRKARESKEKDLSGFSIEKLTIMGSDRGYMIVDYRGDFPKFGGRDGKWVQSLQEVQPFANMQDADGWLKISKPGGTGPEPAIEKKAYQCGDCPLS
jgi:hypothetical protein